MRQVILEFVLPAYPGCDEIVAWLVHEGVAGVLNGAELPCAHAPERSERRAVAVGEATRLLVDDDALQHRREDIEENLLGHGIAQNRISDLLSSGVQVEVLDELHTTEVRGDAPAEHGAHIRRGAELEIAVGPDRTDQLAIELDVEVEVDIRGRDTALISQTVVTQGTGLGKLHRLAAELGVGLIAEQRASVARTQDHDHIQILQAEALEVGADHDRFERATLCDQLADATIDELSILVLGRLVPDEAEARLVATLQILLDLGQRTCALAELVDLLLRLLGGHFVLSHNILLMYEP